MKKLKNEKELVKKAIALGVDYAEKRGVVEFEPTDSAAEKLEYIYRLLVHDKVIQPLPEDQVSQPSIQHKLAIWASMGGMGTSRSQYHLRQGLVFLDVHPLNKPEVFVSAAHEKCDENGDLQDQATKDMISKQLTALQAWAGTLK